VLLHIVSAFPYYWRATPLDDGLQLLRGIDQLLFDRSGVIATGARGGAAKTADREVGPVAVGPVKDSGSGKDANKRQY
jgi:hypothetical protein